MDQPKPSDSEPGARPPGGRHPRALAPANLLLTLGLSVFGAIVGMQIMAAVGMTPATSIIGAVAAMALARIPLAQFAGFRSPHAQNLAQTSISSATFGAANSLFLPIGIPYLFGLPDLVLPMLVGVSLAMLLDAWMLYRLFDTPVFPARNPWPLGIATAEAIKAGDAGGRQARLLLGGLAVGAAGAALAVPMSALGIALLGGLAAMVAFAVGLLVRAYSQAWFQVDIAALYIPHGVMIGAGLMALVQVSRLVLSPSRAPQPAGPASARTAGAPGQRAGRTLRRGALAYGGLTLLLALGTGLHQDMAPGMLALFVVYAAFSAFVHEIIVGISAMHAGWFPAFAVALITLLLGILLGLPASALVVLAGFTAATGPAFADMGYDLKTGYLLRGEGADPAFERDGRAQQAIAALLGFGVAIAVVALSYPALFAAHQFAPINAAYVAAIKAGISSETARTLALWAVPGALLQALGGSRRQLGVLLATGLLIGGVWAGWMVALGLVARLAARAWLGAGASARIEVFAGGVIAGDALYSFFHGSSMSIHQRGSK
ncbi:MAG: OPT/YSL family transporter [Roseateles sp.]|uniref:OPT/YSL family transporter n=1 Tax=Roseateles sp. TaxID=1971397 RepID=UPI0039E8146E